MLELALIMHFQTVQRRKGYNFLFYDAIRISVYEGSPD
jgi:hypothetical protein